jgi:CheY-like chemotaxis protein
MEHVRSRVATTLPMQSNRSVLVVDDEMIICELLTDVLTEEGYQVATAANGQEALDYLRQNEPPCLILLDMMMPIMDGPAFRAAQRNDPALTDIPVIVMTAGMSRERLETLIEADEYILTPFGIDALLDMVQRYCS